MRQSNNTVEHTDITLPIGMKARAKELGINMSFHASKAIRKEIENQERANNE